jgi:hypothetical protein
MDTFALLFGVLLQKCLHMPGRDSALIPASEWRMNLGEIFSEYTQVPPDGWGGLWGLKSRHAE